MGGESLNYDYVLDLAERVKPSVSPKILDFGCGRGQVVSAGLAKGFDIHGADTFEGMYEKWMDQCDEALRGKLHKIHDNILPFDDNSFDLIISNQVFEHIPDYKKSLEEIHRVLKPGGKLIALFPVQETWYEGHVGLYFPQHFAKWPKLQYNYMLYSKKLGLGFKKPGMSAEEWAKGRQSVLREYCFYHPVKQFIRDIKDVWKNDPEYFMSDYMKWRIARHPKLSSISNFLKENWLDPFLSFACLRRGGTVFVATKL